MKARKIITAAIASAIASAALSGAAYARTIPDVWYGEWQKAGFPPEFKIVIDDAKEGFVDYGPKSLYVELLAIGGLTSYGWSEYDESRYENTRVSGDTFTIYGAEHGTPFGEVEVLTITDGDTMEFVHSQGGVIDEYYSGTYIRVTPGPVNGGLTEGFADTPPGAANEPAAEETADGALTPGDYLGDVLYSDITAYINGYQIPASITDGRTMVTAEDLRNYGFNVDWDADARSLNISPNPGAPFNPLPVQANEGISGAVKCPYVYTDIAAYLSGQKVESFAIDGQTLIDFELLAKYGSVEWDGAGRSLRLTVN